MSSPKLIVILGATGNQGGSVANAFLEDPNWQVRALSRTTSSPKAQALAARGAQVVEADLDKPETVSAAFEGASVIFAVSDFWGIYGNPANADKAKPGQPLNAWAGEHETQQLKAVIDAVSKVPTLERFILSSLTNVAKWSKGKYTRVYHFDSKAKAAEYCKAKYPELWKRTSIFQAGMFLSNFVGNAIMKPVKNTEGTVQFLSNMEPNVKMPFIAADEDTGAFVKELVVNEPAGKNIIAYREYLTLPELASAFARATGLKAEAVTLPKGEFPVPLPEDLKGELEDNFAACNEFGYESWEDPDVIHPRDLKSPLSLGTVEDFFRKQDLSTIFGA